MKTTIIFLALLCGAVGQRLEVPSEVYVTSTRETLNLTYSSNLSIRAGTGQIIIDLKTGNVELPKDMKLPDAAMAFWLRVAQAFPECRRAIISGDTTPLTTIWGDDWLKKYPAKNPSPNATIAKICFIAILPSEGRPGYEFGLRSDGVTVWREIKP